MWENLPELLSETLVSNYKLMGHMNSTLMKKYHSTPTVQPWYTMVHCNHTMVHPCATMVQTWYKNLCHGTLYLYHSTSICNHMERFTCTMVCYGVPSYIMIQIHVSYTMVCYGVPWCNLVQLWYIHGTNNLYHGMLSLKKIY